jgi:hypothetical protein
MKMIPKIILFLIIAVGFFSCASKDRFQTQFPQEIKGFYFEKEKSAEEILFYIEFKKPLSQELRLEKIYFRNQDSKIAKLSSTLYKAYFLSELISKDLILEHDSRKEYGNKAPLINKPKFDLKPDEALLEYKSNNSLQYFKLTPVKEREMILQP